MLGFPQRNCTDAPTGQVLLAVRQFNQREWYECHETLEALWMHATGEARYLYQGIIQIAVALHHWRNGNFQGAVLLLEGGVAYLRRLPACCMWLDVTGLIGVSEKMREAVLEKGEAEMHLLPDDLIPIITTVSA